MPRFTLSKFLYQRRIIFMQPYKNAEHFNFKVCPLSSVTVAHLQDLNAI